MNEITVKSRQSYIDLSMEICDDASFAVDIALRNGQSVTDVLKAGEVKKIPVSLSLRKSHFNATKHKPSSALTEDDINLTDQLPPERDSWRIFDYTFDELFN